MSDLARMSRRQFFARTMAVTPARPGVRLAATDRIALDAVGLAILKDLGTTEAIMSKTIFEQDQLARAGELEIIAADEDGRLYADKLRAFFAKEVNK